MYINPNIESLYRIHSNFSRKDYLRLDMNENPVGLPQVFFDTVMKNITPALLATYPELDVLAAMIAQKHGVDVSNIAIGNGSDELIMEVFSVFGERGKALVCVNPSFAMYTVYANMFGMSLKALDYDAQMNVSISTILEAIDGGTGIVILVNPNNPMGNVYSESEIAAVADKAAQVGALLVVDEAYHYFYPNSFESHVLEYNNLILTRTFSKVCSIAGLRLGYAIANERLADLLRRSQPSYNTNVVALEFGKAILSDPSVVDWLILRHAEGKKHIQDRLRRMGYKFLAREGNFIFIETKLQSEEVVQRLQEKKILVKHYKHPLVSGYIRVTTADKDSMDKFMNALLEIDS